MNRFLKVLLIAGCCGFCAYGADLVGDVQLKSGKLLHHVKVVSDEPDSLVVFATEGMIKVKKADLPDALVMRYPLREAPPPPPQMMNKPLTQASAVQPAVPHKPLPLPLPKPPPIDPGLFRGCVISNFQLKPIEGAQGCVEVTVHNTTDAAVEIQPNMLECVTHDGVKHLGNRFFVINDLGSMSMKKVETVPANGDATDVVFYSNDALDLQDLSWVKH